MEHTLVTERLLSVALMNRPGALADVARALGDAGVNIEALTVDTHSEIGVARFLVSDVDKGLDILEAEGHPVQILYAFRLSMDHRPGALADTCAKLSARGVNIELVFGGASPGSKRGDLIIGVDDFPSAKKALGIKE
ncbi:MAG: ACT domain-containing protein [Methanobacteriota archaeon]